MLACCKGVVNAPFAVINADDYYGRSAFKTIYDFLEKAEDGDKFHYAMVGYRVKNTVTEQGGVSRGVCASDENDMLTAIVETHGITTKDGRIFVTEAEGEKCVRCWAYRDDCTHDEEGQCLCARCREAVC